MELKIPKLCGFLLFMSLLIVTGVRAEQIVKTVELPIGYHSQIGSETTYLFPVTIDFPDGISEILSAELIVRGDFQGDTSLIGKIRGTGGNLYDCSPSSWRVPLDSAGYEMRFDCSSLVKQYGFTEGDFEFGIRSDKIAINISPRLRLTYYNRPVTIAQVFGTEYIPSENGTIFLQLFDSNENTVDDAYCEINIYYPDKTIWYDSIYMDFLESGLYYKDIMIPDNELGVFMTSAFCSYEENVYEYKLPSEDVLYDGSLMTLNYLSTDDAENVEDTDCVFVATDGGDYQEFRYNYTTIGNLNLTLIDELSLFWVGSNERNGAYLEAWNFDTSSWDTIGDTFTRTDTTPFECERSHAVSRSITSDISDYVYQDEVRFRMITGSNGEIYTDEATIIFHGIGTFIDSIRGGGEIHVSSIVNQTFNCSIGDVSADVNVSEISEEVWSYVNRSLTENITASVDIDLCDVWDCPSRTITQNFTCDQDLGNVSVSASLTDICPDDCEIGQLQYSYPVCSCYCEDPCSDGKVQDDHCNCYTPDLSEIRIQNSTGIGDVLSYEASIKEFGTDIALSGVMCDIVIYRGDEVFKVIDDIASQKSGVLLGQYRVNDDFMANSQYNFTIRCGEDMIYKEFTVTTQHRPNLMTNVILFISENSSLIALGLIMMVVVIAWVISR